MIRRICAYCSKEYGTINCKESGESHGICPFCAQLPDDVLDRIAKIREQEREEKKRLKMAKKISVSVLVLVCLGLVLAFCCGCYPRLTSPGKLAAWSNCDPSYIADWIGAMTAYEVQSGYPKAEDVMQSGVSDCKGRAVIAVETLKACGYQSHIVLLSNPAKPADHVIAVFSKPGQRGFIDASKSGQYPESKSWREVVASVGDGNWKAVFAEDVK